jgi:hypothetical protein
MIRKKRAVTAAVLSAVMIFAMITLSVSAKTHPEGQTVSSVLFYVENEQGERVLVSHMTVPQMEADMKAGKIDDTLHNYSLLDKYVTTVHQEAEGMTVPEFVRYAVSKSKLSGISPDEFSFMGDDEIRFWEIDQTGYDDYDTYSYNDLYGVERYNFPLLYKYWNYRTQEYYDPDGVMTEDQVKDYIFENGEPETMIMSVRAYSQRYIVTDSKYGTGDYNMENLWSDSGLLDNERAIRLMIPMTKEELYDKVSTASNTRYWVSQILLDMADDPDITSQGTVAAPTASMTEDDDYYYIRFSCDTDGALIYYNNNFISPGYMPTALYKGGTVRVSKSDFPDGEVTMTAHAVKDGYTDAGVVTLKLRPDGVQTGQAFSDVSSSSWYSNAVSYVSKTGLMIGNGRGQFFPDMDMQRYMLAEILYRYAGSPDTSDYDYFDDISRDSVTWSYENGIVSGVSDKKFEPYGSITREQTAAMLYRYAKASGMDMSASGDLSSFSDSSSVSSWAYEAVRWACGAGVLNGTGDGRLDPQGTATRAELAQMMRSFSELS